MSVVAENYLYLRRVLIHFDVDTRERQTGFKPKVVSTFEHAESRRARAVGFCKEIKERGPVVLCFGSSHDRHLITQQCNARALCKHNMQMTHNLSNVKQIRGLPAFYCHLKKSWVREVMRGRREFSTVRIL